MMKTCPLLWRQSEGWGSSLLEKSVELDDHGADLDGSESGAGSECLGAACRFCLEGGDCLLERVGRLMTGEQIAEGLQLATATLTDEIRAALDCTAGPLRAIQERLAAQEQTATAALERLERRWEELAARLAAESSRASDGEGWDRLSAQHEARQLEIAAQLGDLAGRLAQATGNLGNELHQLRDEVAAERVAQLDESREHDLWRQQLQSRLQESDEKWENMFLSLTELTDRLETSLSAVQEHIAQESRHRERSEKEAQLAAAKRENNAGVVHYHSGDMERARARFVRAIALAPDFVEAYNNLGLVETELGNAEEATRHFQKAIELDPALSASYNNLGYVFFLQQNYEEAIAMYEEAIERAENGSAAWTNLGNAHYRLGHHDHAREAWQKALELDPGNRKAADNLARLLQAEPV